MKPQLRDEELPVVAGRLLRDGTPGNESGTEAEKRRFIERVTSGSVARARRPRAMLLAFAAGLTMVLCLALWWSSRAKLVAYTVEGAQLSDGGFVQAPSDSEATVHFDDGSTVTLAAGARGRINDVRPRGVRFSIETGSVMVEVARREGGADYTIDAGPYAVTVTGTRFRMSWQPALERMELDLVEGSVVITGPQAEAGLKLRAGQNVTLEPKGIRVGEAGPATVPSAEAIAPTAATSAEPAPTAGSAVASATTSGPKAERAPTWAERVASGDFEGLLADAEARGLDATLAGAGAGDLMTLADAARYGGRGQLASDALRAVRKRFPGTKPASTAAFLLGRMAEDGGRAEAAINLYDTTLSEGGTFASEALGRKMLLIKRRSGNAGAHPTAEQYLKSYPRGPYAAAARAIADP